MTNEKEIKYFSTFSGIGGFELGIERAFHNRPQSTLRNKTDGHCANGSREQKRETVSVSCVGYGEFERATVRDGGTHSRKLQTERQLSSKRTGAESEGRTGISNGAKSGPLVCCVGHQSADPQSEPSFANAQVRLQKRQAVQELSRDKRRQRHSDQEGRGVLSADIGRERSVCVGFSEIDKYAAQIYQRHFPDHTNYGDITKIDASALPDFDLYVGGFPCQAFSIAGKRAGFNDTRGTLFFDVARLLKAKRPARFLLENVKGLLSHDDGRTFKTIISTLIELGYGVEWQVLNSKDFGVPQNRERVFIVGHLGGESGQTVFPLGSNDKETPPLHQEPTEVAQTIIATYARNQSDAQYVSEEAQIRRLTPTECERLQGFPDGWTEGISDTQRYKTLGNAVTVNVIEAVMRALMLH